MRRIYVRALILAAVLSGVGFVFLNTQPKFTLEDVLDLSRLQPEQLPQLLQRIRDFHRVVTRDGEKLLEVSAKEASYFRDDKTIEILEPKVIFYSEGRSVVTIAGGRGHLVMDGNAIAAIQLSGSVDLQLAKFRIVADSIEYDRASDRIRTIGETTVSSPEVELRGTGLSFDLTRKTLHVDADVDMMLRPSETDPASTPGSTHKEKDSLVDSGPAPRGPS